MATAGESSQGKPNNEVPIFLRKTYHMIDCCDTNIACWSEDGQTFIVKDTDVFEKSIIPQFFKHSKFSSFVRQLNFYGFRKIKYADTIKIDAKLEAETANFWRFRHEKFIRGQPELLIEIKRSNGHQSAAKKSTPTTVKSSEDSSTLKNEVTSLKKRIEMMTKNIDELTSMVQKVTLKQEQGDTEDSDLKQEVGSKRKKIDSSLASDVRPDAALSSPTAMELDGLNVDTSASLPAMPPLQPASRETSGSDTSRLTDNDFVDQLFTEFGDEGDIDELLDIPVPATSPPAEDDNAPEPRLMKKMSDALKLLPREMQEMIVDRLVANIMGSDSVESNMKAATTLSNATKPNKVIPGGKVAPNQVPPSPVLDARPSPDQQKVSMPLAAATLAALLSHYGTAVKDKSVLKALPPVIPIHA